jgi:hypothetical protein
MKSLMILFLFDPLGHYMDKVVIPYPTVQSCNQAKIHKPEEIGFKRVCVSLEHWQGKKQDKGIPLELDVD